MNKPRVLLLAVLACPLGIADTFNPPDGARSWIELTSFMCDSDGSSTNLADRGECGAALTDLSPPPGGYPNYTSVQTLFLTASAQITPSSMHLYLEQNFGLNDLVASMFDTYTLIGPAVSSPLAITAHFDVGGTATRRETSTSRVLGGGSVTAKIGNWVANNPFSEIQRVFALSIAGDSMPDGLGPLSKNFDVQVNRNLLVTPGTPFDLAWSVRLNGQNGVIMDFGNSAFISFDLPDGYALTSLGGYSQGLPPVGAVPEPQHVAVLAAGLIAIAWGVRRKRVGQ